SGEPNGLMIDGAYALIHAAMPPTPVAVLRRAYRDGVHFQSSRGVTATKYGAASQPSAGQARSPQRRYLPGFRRCGKVV
ncbi:hypothetical protein P3C24_13170, partial [Pseudomonas proteolytica]|uniref:hypothetical protein n=1 Tax=Pseudomonas proteolytica TaxID=219574 RepID=UPI0023DF4CB1